MASSQNVRVLASSENDETPATIYEYCTIESSSPNDVCIAWASSLIACILATRQIVLPSTSPFLQLLPTEKLQRV